MVAKLMELSNTLFRYRGSAVAGGAEWDEAVRLLLLMLAPAAPHIAEELWSRRLAARGEDVVVDPHRDVARGGPRAVAESTREVPVQVNGKVRDRIVVPAGADAAAIEAAVLASPRIQAGPGRPRAGPDHPGRRRAPREPGRAGLAVGEPGARAAELGRAASPATRRRSRLPRARSRRSSARSCPTSVVQFDPGNGLLAFGRSMQMRDLLFALIPHAGWVNLQLADGALLPNPDGLIEGTGKRIRHVKVRGDERVRRATDPRGRARPARAALNAASSPASSGGRRPRPASPLP